eukprot:gb/GECH01011550.1/.p1 GENE.gb/GECH01011550.1/~~gb/GECH01011550.1/.p1  ORF type:complete len:210 (+),score=57.48 gb/GECH01011550.1/:1-630(+)
MTVKVQIIFYSTYGHIFKLAKAIQEGAKKIDGVEVDLYRVEETLSKEILEKMGAVEAQKAFEDVPVITRDKLKEADAIIFGSPTRFGMVAAQMKAFLDSTGSLWQEGALVDKIGSVFVSTASQHGGQETTITSLQATLQHHGMIVVGVPYSCTNLFGVKEVSGGTPYGATTMTDGDGSRMPSDNELEICRFQGERVARLAKTFADGKSK